MSQKFLLSVTIFCNRLVRNAPGVFAQGLGQTLATKVQSDHPTRAPTASLPLAAAYPLSVIGIARKSKYANKSPYTNVISVYVWPGPEGHPLTPLYATPSSTREQRSML